MIKGKKKRGEWRSRSSGGDLSEGWRRGRRRGAVWSCFPSARYSGGCRVSGRGAGVPLCVSTAPELRPRPGCPAPRVGGPASPRFPAARATAAPWVAATRGCRDEPAPLDSLPARSPRLAFRGDTSGACAVPYPHPQPFPARDLKKI